MAINGIQPDLVKYEMRMAQGVSPHDQAQKRPGAFGRFLSGMGRVLGSVAFPLSFLFPPAAIAAAAMYGTSSIGDQAQRRVHMRQVEQAQKKNAMNISFPGMGGGSASLQPVSAADTEVMEVLFARDAAEKGGAQLL